MNKISTLLCGTFKHGVSRSLLISLCVIALSFSWSTAQAEKTKAKDKSAKQRSSKTIEKKKDTALKVKFKTTAGNFVVKLFPDKAPITVQNFLTYVRDGYYDDTLFHRVIPEFMVQAGGFEKGMVAKTPRASIKNESLNGLLNKTGTIAMARKGHPDSATSQFYINLANNDDLNPRGSQFGYTVFGKVVKGMQTIKKIARTEVGSKKQFNDVPLVNIRIKTVAGRNAEGEWLFKDDEDDMEIIAGQHYVELQSTRGDDPEAAIEVLEFCHYCTNFDSIVNPWAAKLDEYVEFKRTPFIEDDLMRLSAHAFYTIEAQKRKPKLYKKLIDAIALDDGSLSSKAMMAKFFVANGVDKKTFAATFDSQEVSNKVAAAEALVKKYRIKELPVMIVNGKYRVSAKTAGSQENLLKIVDQLLKKELGKKPKRKEVNKTKAEAKKLKKEKKD
jgi:cyclophilin family peptidyl-prolyl cis-trans isomerase